MSDSSASPGRNPKRKIGDVRSQEEDLNLENPAMQV